MRERDPFGLPGAARGVLHQREIVGTRSWQGWQRIFACAREGFGDDDVTQAFDVRAQQVAEGNGLGHGDQQRGPGVREDAGRATQVVRQLGRPGRRVDGNGHGAGEDHTGEGDEIRPAGGQHDGDRLARHDVVRDQPGR